MKLSIIITAYNAEKYLKECLDSIVSQQVPECEILLINDGSNDSTGKILDKYAKKYINTKVFHTKNLGTSAARNLGMKKSQGDFLWFIDSDDTISNKAIKIILQNIEKNDLLVFGIKKFNKTTSDTTNFQKETISMHDAQNRITQDNDIMGYLANKIFRKTILVNNNLEFDNHIKTCEDLLFCMKYTAYVQKIQIIPDILYNYRQRKSSSLHSKLNLAQATAIMAYAQILHINDLSPQAKTKTEALYTKAFYKYKPLIKQTAQYSNFKKPNTHFYNPQYTIKDNILINGYRFINPIMQFLHIQQWKGRTLYE